MVPRTSPRTVAVVATAIDKIPPSGKSIVVVAGMLRLRELDAVPVGQINVIGFVWHVNTSLAMVCAPCRLLQSTMPPVEGSSAAAAVNFAPKLAPVTQY